MGLLRLTLAVAVVLAHVEGCTYSLTGGATSVQSFYIISGFFMAMILDLKYSHPDQNDLFYSNRLLRIFPLYWMFFALMAGFQLMAEATTHRGVFPVWIENIHRLGWGGAAFLAFSNLAIFGQSWTLFLRLGEHGLHWSSQLGTSTPSVSSFLFIPPAWSLDVELSFYLIAPLILRRRTPWIAGVLLMSLGLRYALWNHGLRVDPWSYRFFPAELSTFLMGSLAYRLIYLRLKGTRVPLAVRIFAFGLFPAIALYPLYDRSHGLFFAPTQILFLAYVVFAVPVLFHATGKNHLDRTIGELSFPLYLGHQIVLQSLRHTKLASLGVALHAAVGVLLSIAVAYLAVVCFDEPLDRFRQARIERNRRSHGEPAVAPGTEPLGG